MVLPSLRCGLHSSSLRRTITPFRMPAMSPTMSEGGIASWKVKEGGSFAAGDVLLEIETDKATIDVEAQDDGVLGKILVREGSKNIPVGKTIALLAEEGDNFTDLDVPEETPAPQASTTPPTATQQPVPSPEPLSHHAGPTHSRPLFPSVHRLLVLHSIDKPDVINGTGVRGMLTKGDVLAYLGKASGPTGTFKPSILAQNGTPQQATKEEPKPLDGVSLRRIIVYNMLHSSLKAKSISTVPEVVDFDSIITDYLPVRRVNPPGVPKASIDYFHGLL